MDISSNQFLPASLMSMRRTSTGSLTCLRKGSSHHDCSAHASSTVRPNCQRHNPIAGGSWDDNSVGHGSVAARMRRERNRAIQRTKSSVGYVVNSINTHAHITSTLNLINTTSLSPWKGDDLLPWDDDFDLTKDLSSAASKRSAGSLCNIRTLDSTCQWDARSIPDHSRIRPVRRTPYRHSYTSTAVHHSSPTSGCASVAGSDLDSSDLAFFSTTDDSSFFDGDSLFSDAMLDTDSGFSSNIYNLLEEGSISCRTPFLNGDWPDSISEFDFDCSDHKEGDVSNCDAHSDIGPSCSAPDERNRLKKRQVRPDPTRKDDGMKSEPLLCNPPQSFIPPVIPPDGVRHNQTSYPLQCPVPILVNPPINVDSFLVSPTSSLKLNTKETDATRIPGLTSGLSSSTSGNSLNTSGQTSLMQEELVRGVIRANSFASQPPPDTGGEVPVEETLASSLSEWNKLPKSVRVDLVEQLSDKISKTMGLQDQLQIIQILGSSLSGRDQFPVSIDDIDSHKLSRVLGYIDTHKTAAPSPHCLSPAPPTTEGTLRRSNSDGNIAKSALEAQKEHRRRQRQARRFAKWLKQRERKESRQHLKEARSGLFLNEEKMKILGGSEEEEIDIDVAL